MRDFTSDELKERALIRVSRILFEQWEESGGGDTRLFEWLIDDSFVLLGYSKNGNEYREHVVPRKVIRDICIQQFEKGVSIKDVAKIIGSLLKIARISNEEGNYLDHVLKLKSTMPEGWDYLTGDIEARLIEANIELEYV